MRNLIIFKILSSDISFSNYPKSGTAKEFFSFINKHIVEEKFNIQKEISRLLEMSANEKKEFRVQENGKIRWKSIRIQKLRNNYSKGYLIVFYDIDKAVKEREERNLKNINDDLVEVLSTIVEFRDTESGEHVFRIKGYTKILLEWANKVYDSVHNSEEQIKIISVASALHDIGKIAIQDNILLKPGRLTPEEFEEMKKHTTKGCEILMTIPKLQAQEYFKYSYDICRHHHERYDGKGYPDGLKGDEISLEAQIVALADVFDALTSDRCYKKAFTPDKAYEMIMNGECGAFAPKLLECFEKAQDDMRKLQAEHKK